MSGRAAGQAGTSCPFPQKTAVGLRGVWMLQGLQGCVQWRRWSRTIKWPQKTPSYWGDRTEATRSLSWATVSAQTHFKGFKDVISTRKQQSLQWGQNLCGDPEYGENPGTTQGAKHPKTGT